MTRLLALLAASALASPVLAQHAGHSVPTAPATETSCTPEHAEMGHCTMPPLVEPVDPHAGHDMPAEEQPAVDPHAGHDMGSGMSQPPKTPPPDVAFTGPEHAADIVYDPQRMAAAREELRREHGDLAAYRVFIERAETRIRDGRDGYLFDAQGWYGGDIDKLWLKAEVEGEWEHGLEEAELQALWSHAIDPWFDLQAGVRYDARSGPDRGHLVLGIQGLAPYWWEVDGAIFLSDDGKITARAEAEYDVRITQRLILQPRVEVDLSLQDIPQFRTGSGLSGASTGVRLRYEINPLFAPYVGVEYERAFGDTRRFLRADGEDPDGWNLLAGLRLWF